MENKEFPEQENLLPPDPTPEESPAPLTPEEVSAEEPLFSESSPVSKSLFPPEEPPEPSPETMPEMLAPVQPEPEIPEPPEQTADVLPTEPAAELHQPFDLSILDDPDLMLPEEAPVAEEVPDMEYRDNGQDFEAMLHAPKQKKPEPELPRQTHKGRPKRKKGEGLLGIPNILATLVWLVLIVAIGVTAGRMLWICAADVLAFGREDKVVTLTIYEADTMDDIVDKLHENGLIRYKSLFNLYASISDAEEDIRPGIYDLNTRYDYHALVNFMSPRSSRQVVTLTIPEGYSNRQIFSLLEEHRICTAVDLENYAATGDLGDYWFLEGMDAGESRRLEGYLFPDTYEFYKNSTPSEAISRMLNNFEVKFDEEMRAQLDTLNANVTGGGYGVREVVIVASLIEKESAAPAESPKVSGVIYNRLFNWGETPAYLNIDASIVYAQNGSSEHIDTKLDSPYNTYTNIGLTPTAIANPGLASLKAALNPEKHNFYYYVLNPSTGMHQFSTTQAEHNAWIDAFYN